MLRDRADGGEAATAPDMTSHDGKYELHHSAAVPVQAAATPAP